MTEVQEQIKSILESSFEQVTGEKIIVEYVTDVNARANEIQTQAGVNMRDVYEATQYTGVFIPATDNSCSYILIQEYRNDNLDIMTAFHEMQHAIEYIMLLNCIFFLKRQPMIHPDEIASVFAKMPISSRSFFYIITHFVKIAI